MMKSIWQTNLQKPTFPTLEGEVQTDVLIIGGGLTGLLCAHLLRQAGVDCILAEANTICGGVTHNTTAKVTYHHGAVFDTMVRRYGVSYASAYLRANQAALERYREMAKGIDCDFTEVTSYVYSCDDRDKLTAEVTALQKLGCTATYVRDLPLPIATVGAVCVPCQAQFHPLKFAYALAKNLPVFEHSRITNIDRDRAATEHASIRAKRILVATHFPLLNRHGAYFLKLYQHRSYVLALRGAPDVHGIYVDAAEQGMSFRNYDDLLLLGGGGHRTGKQGGGYAELERFAAHHYPSASEVCRFATQDCMSLDDIPYIGNYAKRTPSLYVATGYNKWGMTSSMVAAHLLTDLILGKPNEYAAVFSPARTILRPQLLVNTGESILGLLRPTAPRCSHLGCALHYNKQEHTWDCACHGSRFAESGEVLDNPATENIRPRTKK